MIYKHLAYAYDKTTKNDYNFEHCRLNFCLQTNWIIWNTIVKNWKTKQKCFDLKMFVHFFVSIWKLDHFTNSSALQNKVMLPWMMVINIKLKIEACYKIDKTSYFFNKCISGNDLRKNYCLLHVSVHVWTCSLTITLISAGSPGSKVKVKCS